MQSELTQLPLTECEPLPVAHATIQGRKRLEQIFNDNHEFVWRLLRRLGLNRERAADMTQQHFSLQQSD